jgi:two-component system chemotaxis sensor kinase CheA
VVARAVEDCKGELTIDTTLGSGTTISIGLPLSLAVTQVLTVEVDGQTYCIPTLAVEMVRMVAPAEVLLVADRPAVKLGRRTVPLLQLSAVLGIGGHTELPRNERLSVVLLGHARQRVALVVDRLVAVQEIVIKSFGRVLRNLPNVAGATILGTGDVSVVLHASDLVKNALSLAGKLVPLALSGTESRGRVADKPVLVVEDSLTTREMEKDILASAGFMVDTAVDGRDGLEKARAKSYGLFLVDLQMPVMDGFALIQALRKSSDYATTPIVILSSLGSDQDRRRGLEMGADAYLVKSQFNPDVLLDAVRRFVGQPPRRPGKRRARTR